MENFYNISRKNILGSPYAKDVKKKSLPTLSEKAPQCHQFIGKIPQLIVNL
jgi:hypothetical protein